MPVEVLRAFVYSCKTYQQTPYSQTKNPYYATVLFPSHTVPMQSTCSETQPCQCHTCTCECHGYMYTCRKGVQSSLASSPGPSLHTHTIQSVGQARESVVRSLLYWTVDRHCQFRNWSRLTNSMATKIMYRMTLTLR